GEYSGISVGDPGIHFRSGTGGALRSERPPLRHRKFFVRQDDESEATRRSCCIPEETRPRICFPLFVGQHIVGEQLIASSISAGDFRVPQSRTSRLAPP